MTMEPLQKADRISGQVMQLAGQQRGSLLLLAVLTCSLSLNVVLGLKLRAIEPIVVRPAGIQAGDDLPAFPGLSLDGSATAVTFGRPTLLYLFSPLCEWCQKEYANLVAISQAASPRFDVVGVARTERSLKEYLVDHPFPGRVVIAARDTMPEAIQRDFGLTPQLVVVAAGGEVQRAWSGALFGATVQEVELFFGVTLPGHGGAAGLQRRQ
jgi:hypothetical protein